MISGIQFFSDLLSTDETPPFIYHGLNPIIKNLIQKDSGFFVTCRTKLEALKTLFFGRFPRFQFAGMSMTMPPVKIRRNTLLPIPFFPQIA